MVEKFETWNVRKPFNYYSYFFSCNNESGIFSGRGNVFVESGMTGAVNVESIASIP